MRIAHLLVDTPLRWSTMFVITMFLQASGRDKFTFELKWYIPLSEIVIFEEPAVEPRENSPANIVTLKSQACTVRDQILRDEKSDDKVRSRSVQYTLIVMPFEMFSISFTISLSEFSFIVFIFITDIMLFDCLRDS